MVPNKFMRRGFSSDANADADDVNADDEDSMMIMTNLQLNDGQSKSCLLLVCRLVRCIDEQGNPEKCISSNILKRFMHACMLIISQCLILRNEESS